MVVSRPRKLVATVALFAMAVIIVIVAGTINDVGPLFLVWLPLLAVPWILTRPEPGDPILVPKDPSADTTAAREANGP